MTKQTENFILKSPLLKRKFPKGTLPVKIVYGVAPVVLNMPAERGEAHPHIKPGNLHPTDVGCNVSQHGGIEDRHVVQVPAAAQVMLQVRDRCQHYLHLTGSPT